jgi:transcriptional regulator of arginine metabolism
MSTVDDRLQAIKQLLVSEEAGTQDEIRVALEDLKFDVNQSTISRDLKRVGAVKMIDAQGRTVYRLNESSRQRPPTGLSDLLVAVDYNEYQIVITTTPGSASLIARYVDQFMTDVVLGTIAGDDTVFVAPVSVKNIKKVASRIEASLKNQ